MARPRHAMASRTLRATKYWRHMNQVKDAWNLIKYQDTIDTIEELHQQIVVHTMEAQKILETVRDLKKEI